MYKIPHCKVLRYWKRQFFLQYRPTVTSKTKNLERKCKSSTNDCNDSRSVSSYSGWCITMIAGFLCSCFFFFVEVMVTKITYLRRESPPTLLLPAFLKIWIEKLARFLQVNRKNLEEFCKHLGTRMHSIERLLSIEVIFIRGYSRRTTYSFLGYESWIEVFTWKSYDASSLLDQILQWHIFHDPIKC